MYGQLPTKSGVNMKDVQDGARPRTSEPPFAVLDIPASATADEAAALLNEHCGGFYINAVVEWPGIDGRRVFLKRRGRSAGDGFKPAPPDAVADRLIGDNIKMGVGKLVQLLRDNGSRHGKDWILKRKIEIASKQEAPAPGA